MSTRILHQLKSPQDLEDMFLALNRDIYAYIAARVRERAIAEDIAQEVFIKAWEKRRQFNPAKGSLKNWTYAIALNAVRDYFRRNTLRATEELPEEVWDTTNIESDIATAQLHTLWDWLYVSLS